MVPDDDTIDFLFHASRWWLSEFGGFAVFRAETGVLLPVDAHFPVPPELEGQARAEALFACVAHHCGVVDWPWQLDAEAPPSVADALAGMAHHMTAAPTGGESQPIDDDGPLPVPYDPAMVANPTALVADFARAVSHYYLYDAKSELPVEDEDREYVVDLSAGLLGFGVFQASSAFEFGQHEAGMMVGWGTTRRGSLGELGSSYLLAMVVTLLETPPKTVLAHLSGNPKSYFSSAMKHLSRQRARELDELRTVVDASEGPYR